MKILSPWVDGKVALQQKTSEGIAKSALMK